MMQTVFCALACEIESDQDISLEHKTRKTVQFSSFESAAENENARARNIDQLTDEALSERR